MASVGTRKVVDNLHYEKALWAKGVSLIAGVDEVGRGALAGPMVVGAVILKPGDLAHLTNNDIYSRITDSKLLSPKNRRELSAFIVANCLCYSVSQVSAQDIDAYGLSACTQQAFLGAVNSLTTAPEHVLTDAFPIKAFPQTAQTNIIAGDLASITISAASIVAKVFRDALMCDLAKLADYTNYGFDQHKGYGTKLHLARIGQHGLSNIHRTTFIHCSTLK
jgi:ribonuclease HII